VFCGIFNNSSEVFPGGYVGKADGGRRDGTSNNTGEETYKKETYKKEINYPQLASQAVVNLGVSYTEFWDLSLAELHYMHVARGEYENIVLRRMYVVARFEAYLVLQPHLDKEKEIGPVDIYRFPWEEEKKQEKQTPEEMKAAMKKMALSFGTKPEQKKLDITKKE